MQQGLAWKVFILIAGICAAAILLATRPTAINLKWALDEVTAAVRNRPRAERAAAA